MPPREQLIKNNPDRIAQVQAEIEQALTDAEMFEQLVTVIQQHDDKHQEQGAQLPNPKIKGSSCHLPFSLIRFTEQSGQPRYAILPKAYLDDGSNAKIRLAFFLYFDQKLKLVPRAIKSWGNKDDTAAEVYCRPGSNLAKDGCNLYEQYFAGVAKPSRFSKGKSNVNGEVEAIYQDMPLLAPDLDHWCRSHHPALYDGSIEEIVAPATPSLITRLVGNWGLGAPSISVANLSDDKWFEQSQAVRQALQVCIHSMRSLYNFHQAEFLPVNVTGVDNLQVNPRKFVHRDIKPENISYNEKQGEACLLDFDSAIPLELNHADEQEILGTSHFMAPEVFSAPEQRSDIYSMAGVCGRVLGCPGLLAQKEAANQAAIKLNKSSVDIARLVSEKPYDFSLSATFNTVLEGDAARLQGLLRSMADPNVAARPESLDATIAGFEEIQKNLLKRELERCFKPSGAADNNYSESLLAAIQQGATHCQQNGLLWGGSLASILGKTLGHFDRISNGADLLSAVLRCSRLAEDFRTEVPPSSPLGLQWQRNMSTAVVMQSEAAVLRNEVYALPSEVVRLTQARVRSQVIQADSSPRSVASTVPSFEQVCENFALQLEENAKKHDRNEAQMAKSRLVSLTSYIPGIGYCPGQKAERASFLRGLAAKVRAGDEIAAADEAKASEHAGLGGFAGKGTDTANILEQYKLALKTRDGNSASASSRSRASSRASMM